MQIINLIYSTVFTSIDHFPHFIPLFLMVNVLVLLFGGISLVPANKKTTYLIPAYYYAGVSIFVVLVDILARFGMNYISTILSIGMIFLATSIYGYVVKWKLIKQFYRLVGSQKVQWLTILGVVLLSTFFFSKFIYGNGLHDEYQHHAAVEDMLQIQHWPIRDEMRYGIDLSTYYHYGWYYLVILVKEIFPVSIEVALDLVKLMLFVPMVPLFFVLIDRYIKTKWYESIFLSVALLVQGPALFLFDAYAGNVLLSQGNEIIYEPLFFQLAGVTWFGKLVLVALLAIGYSIIKMKHFLPYIMFSLWVLFLLNKVTILFFIPIASLLFIHEYSTYLVTLPKKRYFFHVIFLIAIMCLLGLWVGMKNAPPLFFTLFRGESGIPFLRPMTRIGFPFSSYDGLAFEPLFSMRSLRAFGIIPLVALFLSIRRFQKTKIKSLLILVTLAYFWLTPVLLNFSESELVLNKFYIPALWISVLFVVKYVLNYFPKLRRVMWVLLASSIVAPTLYFMSISIPGSNIYWGFSDEIIDALPADRLIYVYIDKSDVEYAKQIINSAQVQLIYNEEQLQFIDEYYEVRTYEKPNEDPLAQTTTHYLYSK